MKMKLEHYKMLESAINERLKVFSNINLYAEYKKAGLSDMRYRWDLFHIVNPGPNLPFRFLNEYLNDNHIDTALKKITGTK